MILFMNIFWFVYEKYELFYENMYVFSMKTYVFKWTFYDLFYEKRWILVMILIWFLFDSEGPPGAQAVQIS